MKSIYIIGAGGLGRDVAAMMLHSKLQKQYKVTGFIDDNKEINASINNIPVIGGIDWLAAQTECNVILAVGDPVVRRKIIDKVRHYNIAFPTIIHPEARIYDTENVIIGYGSFIADSCVLTTNILIGDFAFLHVGCSLHHDTVLGENVMLMPGVRITKGSFIEADTRIETGTFGK